MRRSPELTGRRVGPARGWWSLAGSVSGAGPELCATTLMQKILFKKHACLGVMRPRIGRYTDPKQAEFTAAPQNIGAVRVSQIPR